jgi:hypothetical protein
MPTSRNLPICGLSHQHVLASLPDVLTVHCAHSPLFIQGRVMPASMKAKREHRVLLSEATMRLLTTLKEIRTCDLRTLKIMIGSVLA